MNTQSNNNNGNQKKTEQIQDKLLQEMGRTMPHAQEAECAILGAILIDNDSMHDIAQKLKVADFYISRHQVIYQAILTLYDVQKKIDYVTLENQLATFAKEDEFGGLEYLTGLPEKVPYIPNVEQYVDIIRKNSIRRQLIKLTTEMNIKSFDSSIEVTSLMDELDSKVFAVTQSEISTETYSIKDILNSFFQNVERYKHLDSPITGIPSGFSGLDDLTAGFQKGEMIVVAGRPSMGKTTLALNIARYVGVVSNFPVVFFSCEMSRLQLGQNMLCAQARVNSSNLRTYRLSEAEHSRIGAASGQLGEAPIFVDDTPGIGMRELAAKSRRLVQQHDAQIIFIDYLQLMTPPELGRNSNREQQISTMSRNLKALARELNVPIVVLAQLNRGVEQRQGKQGSNKPRMSDLRESGAIEQDADVIILLHRDYYYTRNDDDKNQATIIVAKQRNGPTGEIEISYQMPFMLFDNLAEGYNNSEPYDSYGGSGMDDDIEIPNLPSVNFTDDDQDTAPFDDYNPDDEFKPGFG